MFNALETRLVLTEVTRETNGKDPVHLVRNIAGKR